MQQTWTASATVTEHLAAPAARAWELLSDFHSLPKRMADITHFVVEGAGAGAVRTFRLGDGPILQERIEVFEPQNYRLAYSLLPPAFLENYIAEIVVAPEGPDECQVTWSGRCSVHTEKEVIERRAFFETVFKKGIDWVRKELLLR